MLHAFSRTEMLIGTRALEKLNNSWVAVFGIGGVGSYAVEGLVRSGVGKFTLIDDDCVCLTNINRQIHATKKTVGKFKVEVMKDRILDINPKASVEVFKMFYERATSDQLINEEYNYIIDAIDTVSSKIDLIVSAKQKSLPIISSMGAGNKLNPDMLEVDDIYNTTICPLAKVMRKELRKRDVDSLKVVYSKEVPIKPIDLASNCHTNCICPKKDRTCTKRRQIPGSVSFVPSAAGLIIAAEVVKDLINEI